MEISISGWQPLPKFEPCHSCTGKIRHINLISKQRQIVLYPHITKMENVIIQHTGELDTKYGI